MKKITIIICALCLLTFNSCKDEFLDVPLYGAYTAENLVSKDAVNKLLINCYSAMGGEMTRWGTNYRTPSQWFTGEVHAGSIVITAFGARDLLQCNATAATGGILDYWNWLYDGVFRCNQVIEQLDVVDDMTDAEKLQVEAEARYLRAHFYFYLKRTFNNVPWVENTKDLLIPNTENNDGTSFVNIWPQIAADMDFARQNLPETQDDLGRPNSWAANCYYAKILIYRANFGEYADGYSEALTVLNNVMANGVTQKGEKYALVDDFYHLFSAAHENSSESVMAIQHTVNDGTTQNSPDFGASIKGNFESYFVGSPSPSGPAWGNGIGWGTITFWVVDHYRTTENGLPYLDMFETNPNSIKNDYGILSTEDYEPETAPLDPRIDWTVGRRGIPFLDYGVNPGIDWMRGQDSKGPYLQKKVFVRDDEAGIYTKDKANPASALNVYVIRYADVLLWAAECNARLGNLGEARNLVNQVRNRMAQNPDSPDNWVKNEDGSNAANYVISPYPADGSEQDAFTNTEDALDAILYERSLELAGEGHRFFDVIRFGKDEVELPAAHAHNAQWLGVFGTASYTRQPDQFLPIPRTVIDNSQVEGIPTITQNPGY